jgi:hypothetical protein
MSSSVTRASIAASLAVLLTTGLTGCAGPGEVRFDRDGCSIDGRAADLPRVEEREAWVQHRIARRQPWLVLITVAVVALAGIGYIERLVLLFSARRDAGGMAKRLQSVIDRYRSHPVRYFALLAGSVGALLAAGSLYIYCDADKRASERTLGALQFCHLALRSADEKHALDEQRQNLSSIHETAGAIRQLIDKLPPTEQAKAAEIIGHMDDAVGRERRVISEHLQRSEDTAAAIRDRTQSIERGLTGLETDVGGLKDLPNDVHAISSTLGKVDGRVAAMNDKLAEANLKLVATDATVTALQHTIKEIAERPTPVCPACVCPERPTPTAEPATTATTATRTETAPR